MLHAGGQELVTIRAKLSLRLGAFAWNVRAARRDMAIAGADKGWRGMFIGGCFGPWHAADGSALWTPGSPAAKFGPYMELEAALVTVKNAGGGIVLVAHLRLSDEGRFAWAGRHIGNQPNLSLCPARAKGAQARDKVLIGSAGGDSA
jgi:hypothetical protein